MQALLSLHDAMFAACWQPFSGSQLSLVHGLLSSQPIVLPGIHPPPRHASPTVQPLPSSQGRLLLAAAQPLSGSQLSVVQGNPSSQVLGAPGTQRPAAQASLTVQTLPSEHVPPTAKCLQLLTLSQLSSVHGLPSSQLAALLPMHAPALQASTSVHASLSLHVELFGAYAQPLPGSHASSVHGLPSAQTLNLPAWHFPPKHPSFSVHTLPSLQLSALLTPMHPLFGSHRSVVHGLPSSQFLAEPAVQTPTLHASPSVQLLLSEHGAALGTLPQPFLASQKSFVHGLPSSQTLAVPGWQEPPWHRSPSVQTLLSEQPTELFVNTHPTLASQASSVHGLPSLQGRAEPPTQEPAWQKSPFVQTFPSVHPNPLAENTQPLIASQVSVVQGLLSSQGVAGPARQIPPEHMSGPVHRLLSLQASVSLGVTRQPLDLSQLSVVQGFLSSQITL